MDNDFYSGAYLGIQYISLRSVVLVVFNFEDNRPTRYI